MKDSGMDGLEAMMASLEAKPKKKSAPPKKEPKHEKRTLSSLRKKPEVPEQIVQPETNHPPRVQHFCEALRQFSLDLADPATRDKINNALAQKPYDALAEYYEARPELAKYTIEQEVPRMDYKIIPVEGAPITEGGKIKEFFHSSDEHESSILWRFSNQSVLADLLITLREHMVEPHDPSGALCIIVRNVSVSFVLDFTKQTMEAQCVFTIATISMDDPAGLVLGKITGTVSICCKDGANFLRQTVGALELEVVFDDTIAVAAKILAEQEAMGRQQHDQGSAEDIRVGLMRSVSGGGIGAGFVAGAAANGLLAAGGAALNIGSGIGTAVAAGGKEILCLPFLSADVHHARSSSPAFAPTSSSAPTSLRPHLLRPRLPSLPLISSNFLLIPLPPFSSPIPCVLLCSVH
jgi:hypothetical protein